MWSSTKGTDFALRSSLFGAVNLTSNADPDKYKYSGYGNGFDACGSFSLSDGSGLGQNVIIFGANVSSLVHVDKKAKNIFFLGKGPIYGLDDAIDCSDIKKFV